MHQKTTVLVPPSLQNSSCSHPRLSGLSIWSGLGPGEVIQAFIVLMLTVGVLLANLLLILVINSRRYSKYIHSQFLEVIRFAVRKIQSSVIMLTRLSEVLADIAGQQRPGDGTVRDPVRHRAVAEELLALRRISLSDPDQFWNCKISFLECDGVNTPVRGRLALAAAGSHSLLIFAHLVLLLLTSIL